MPSLIVGGATISYRQAGCGPSVILLHASSSHGGQWKPLMEALADRFTLLAPDLHGYGRSDPLPQGASSWSQHDVAIVMALADRVGQPVHLVGHSLGGAIAALAALRRPEAVKSLALIEPVLFNLLEESRHESRCDYLELAHAMLVLLHFNKREEAARLFLDYWAGAGALDRADPETRAYIVRTIPRVADDWYGISSRAPGVPRLVDFARLAMPCLLLCAQHTPRTARAIVALLGTALPHADQGEIAGAGHLSPISHPDRVNSMLIDFLDRHR